MVQEVKVKHEHSAGGVVYERQATSDKLQETQYLLGKHSGYHKWVLPKGLIEEGETSKETALREVEEETGVKARIIGDEPIWVEEYTYVAEYKEEATSDRRQATSSKQPVRRVKTYQENAEFEAKTHTVKVIKKVDFYLMEWVEGDPKDHDWEMEEAGWYGFEEAMQMLEFEGEKKALEVARDRIS